MPLDTKKERTLMNLHKAREVENATMVEQRDVNQNIPVVVVGVPQQRQRTMEDFWRLVIRDEYLAVRQPLIEANNFELKLALITMYNKISSVGIKVRILMSI